MIHGSGWSISESTVCVCVCVCVERDVEKQQYLTSSLQASPPPPAFLTVDVLGYFEEKKFVERWKFSLLS